jgi:SAM-dependent methyltransferase
MSDYRQESRAHWAESAKGWEAHAEALRKLTLPVSSWMVDAIQPQPGDTLLELAAGPGETGFLAAEMIRPGGTLISSDLVPEMLVIAQRRAEELGLDDVRFKQIDAETSIDIEAATIDGVLCRWGYMLMAEPGNALRETRRVLKPGGRVALAAWAGPDENPWSSITARELVRRGLAERPDPDAPGQFAWAKEGVIAEQLAEAGFVEFEVDSVAFEEVYRDFEDYWRTQSEMSGLLRRALAAAGPGGAEELQAALRELVAPYTRGDGSIVMPARTWVAVAEA